MLIGSFLIFAKYSVVDNFFYFSLFYFFFIFSFLISPLQEQTLVSILQYKGQARENKTLFTEFTERIQMTERGQRSLI